MASSPVLDRFIALLCERHSLSTLVATAMTSRAARRKGVTMHDIAAFVMDRTPLPRTPGHPGRALLG